MYMEAQKAKAEMGSEKKKRIHVRERKKEKKSPMLWSYHTHQQYPDILRFPFPVQEAVESKHEHRENAIHV